MVTFTSQLVIGGGVQLMTEQPCNAADRILTGAKCEPSQISAHATKSRSARGRR
jgi:hypothetical protein